MIGTGDGQHFEDEWSYALAQMQQPITMDPIPEGIPRIRVTPNPPPPSENIEDKRGEGVVQPYIDNFKANLNTILTNPHNPMSTPEDQTPILPQGPISRELGIDDVNKPKSESDEPYDNVQQLSKDDLIKRALTPGPETMPARMELLWKRLTGTGGFDRYETMPEHLVKGAFEGLKQFGDAAEGKPLAPDYVERMTDLAGFITLAPRPIVKGAIDGTLGSFAGVKSLTARRGDLDLATQMAEKGMDKDQIYSATGWFKGLDNKWRYEIPDNKAQFSKEFADTATNSIGNKKFIASMSLSDAVKHPELFKAYPELKNVTLQIDNTRDSLGSYLHEVSGYKGDGIAPRYISINLDKILDSPAIHPIEVVMHEIQHAIQREERFYSGTNTSAVRAEAISFLEERIQNLHDSYLKGEKVNLSKMPDLINLKRKFINNITTPEGNSISYQAYAHNPGEIEARAVGARATQANARAMTPMQSLEYEGEPLIIPGTSKASSAESNVINHPGMKAANDNKNLDLGTGGFDVDYAWAQLKQQLKGKANKADELRNKLDKLGLTIVPK